MDHSILSVGQLMQPFQLLYQKEAELILLRWRLILIDAINKTIPNIAII